jgi:hypothetical protein
MRSASGRQNKPTSHDYQAFQIKIQLGEDACVNAADQIGNTQPPNGVSTGSDPAPDVVAEVLFKLAFAIKNGQPNAIALAIRDKRIVRDETYQFPSQPG